MIQFMPAEAFPVAQFVRDEIRARRWNRWVVAARMTEGCTPENWQSAPIYPEVQKWRLVLDCIYCQPKMPPNDAVHFHIGEETAVALERAFGISKQFWLNTDDAYRAWLTRKHHLRGEGG